MTKYIHSKKEPTFRVVKPYVWINPRECRHDKGFSNEKCVQCGKYMKK